MAENMTTQVLFDLGREVLPGVTWEEPLGGSALYGSIAGGKLRVRVVQVWGEYWLAGVGDSTPCKTDTAREALESLRTQLAALHLYLSKCLELPLPGEGFAALALHEASTVP